MDNQLPKGIFTNENKEVSITAKAQNTNTLKSDVNIDDDLGIEEGRQRKQKRKYHKLEMKEWLIVNVIYMFPFINVVECIFFIITKKHPETENWGKGAVIPAVLISLGVLFIIIRMKNMNYTDYINLYNMFH